MAFLYSDVFNSSIDSINTTVANILKEIKPLIEDEDVIFDIRLILNELLINGFEHGNQKDINKLISIKFKLDDSHAYVEVKDEGRGILNDYPYDVCDLKCCGRGLLIVESLSDFVEIENNLVRCSIAL
ncbi:ATP-binding protein [Peptoniphilaceae bacterium SGI.131]